MLSPVFWIRVLNPVFRVGCTEFSVPSMVVCGECSELSVLKQVFWSGCPELNVHDGMFRIKCSTGITLINRFRCYIVFISFLSFIMVGAHSRPLPRTPTQPHLLLEIYLGVPHTTQCGQHIHVCGAAEGPTGRDAALPRLHRLSNSQEVY